MAAMLMPEAQEAQEAQLVIENHSAGNMLLWMCFGTLDVLICIGCPFVP